MKAATVRDTVASLLVGGGSDSAFASEGMSAMSGKQ